MKTILAVDTSGKNLTIALANGKTILQNVFLETNNRHSAILAPLIQEVLEKQNMTVDNVDCFAVCIGPGSFTGVRIGIAHVKAMAYSLEKPCIGISSLDILAYSVKSNKNICSMIDARNNNVYFAKYNNNVELISKYSFDNIENVLDDCEKDAVFVGDGAIKYKDLIVEKFGEKNLSDNNNILADNLAFLAYDKLDSLDLKDNLEKVQPMYINKLPF
jgi:tRNA threonylcarbamoyladenosine biosynthesis protein TsaB